MARRATNKRCTRLTVTVNLELVNLDVNLWMLQVWCGVQWLLEVPTATVHMVWGVGGIDVEVHVALMVVLIAPLIAVHPMCLHTTGGGCCSPSVW